MFSRWITTQPVRRVANSSRQRRRCIAETLENRQLLAGDATTFEPLPTCQAEFAPNNAPLLASARSFELTPIPIASLVRVNDPSALVTPGSVNLIVPEQPTTDILSAVAPVLDTFSVVLTTQPTDTVTVTVDPNGQLRVGTTATNQGAAGAPVNLLFTVVNWNVAQTIHVAAFDDVVAEGDHNGTIDFIVASVDTRFTATATPSVTAAIIDNDGTAPQVSINEVLYSPGGIVDANNDGVFSATADEFVELVNRSTVAVDLSGWTLSDAAQVRHTFAPGTLLAGGGAIVVFGGGTLVGTFGNSQAVVASTGSLNLGDNDDSLTLRSPLQLVDHVPFISIAPPSASLARSPDGIGPFDESTFINQFFERATPGTQNESGADFTLIGGVVVSPTGGSTIVSETGPTSDTISIVLTTPPLADVTVTVNGNNQTTPSPASIIFTNVNWNVPRTVTITAIDDSSNEGNHTGLLTFTTASVDSDYNLLTVAPLTVNLTDNDQNETVPPRLSLVTPSLTKIIDASTGPFELIVAFNENMSNLSTPTITFPSGSPSSAISAAGGSWIDGRRYRALYNLQTSDVAISNIDVRVSGATDLAGNLMIASTQTAVFNIDTQGRVIAHDLVNSTNFNRLSFTNAGATPFQDPEDGFGRYRFGTSPSIPSPLVDISQVANPSDTIGVIRESNTHEFFGAADTRNPNNSAPVTTTWTFNIDGFQNLAVFADIGAMGDFEANDTFTITAQIDSGPQVPVLTLVSDQAGTLSYRMADGDLIPLDDPMRNGLQSISNVLQTISASIAGTGSVMTIRVTSDLDEDNEAIAMQNLIIKGTPIPISPANVVNVAINGGAVSRSQVTSMTVTFDRVVEPAALQNAFSIRNSDLPPGNTVRRIFVSSTVVNNQTVATLTFGTGALAIPDNLIVIRNGTGGNANSLTNGNYELTVNAASVIVAGTSQTMASNYVFGGQTRTQPNNDMFFRLYGDTSGDGFCNSTDLRDVRNAMVINPVYRADLDFNGDGLLNSTDLREIRPTLNQGVRL